jgi:hypothetical protein
MVVIIIGKLMNMITPVNKLALYLFYSGKREDR